MALYHTETFWDLYFKIKILHSTLLSEQIDYCFIIFFFLWIVLSSVVHSKNPFHETKIYPKESSVLLFQTIPHAKKTLDILAKRYLLLNSRCLIQIYRLKIASHSITTHSSLAQVFHSRLLFKRRRRRGNIIMPRIANIGIYNVRGRMWPVGVDINRKLWAAGCRGRT
jgi:hypothetical protein